MSKHYEIKRDMTKFSTGFTDLWVWVYNKETGALVDGIKVGRGLSVEEETLKSNLYMASKSLAELLAKTSPENTLVTVRPGVCVNDLSKYAEEEMPMK